MLQQRNCNKQHLNLAKILHQQCIAYWQSNCQILIKSVKAYNSYSGFCQVTP